MHRYFIQLSYKGSAYCGWQKQPNGVTIQEDLEKSMSLVLGKKIDIMGCGRTDSGVHAHEFFAHFDNETKLETDNLIFRLNSILSSAIAIKNVFEVTENAHSRFDATTRTYRYFINYRKDPFALETSWYLYNTILDLGKMNEASQHLHEVVDFSAFEKIGSDNKTSICNVTFAKWFVTKNGIYFEIRADRFLRNMVRAIVGTLFEVGKGNINLEEFKAVINSRSRANAGSSVPAKGLFLWEITYPLSIRINE
jgi:tRNA pseudouridine38-40 synthase